MTKRPVQQLWIVARQAGTANAFIPLIHYLRSMPNFELRLIAYPMAAKAWQLAGITDISCIEHFGDLALETFTKPDFLLTGTAIHAPDDDAKWWQYAAAQRIDSIAFIDQWVNVVGRFSGAPDASFYPNRIAVIDESVLKQCHDEFMHPELLERLVITGSPAFDQLQPDPDAANALRAQWNIRASDILCLLVHEPLSLEQTPEQLRERFGYCDSEIWADISNALTNLSDTHRLVIAQRAHPIHDDTALYPAHSFGRHLKAEGNRLLWAQAADIVVGMHSMLLLESSMLGKKVVAYQPHRKKASPLTDHRPNIHVVTEPTQLAATIKKVLEVPALRPSHRDTYACSHQFLTQLGLLDAAAYRHHG